MTQASHDTTQRLTGSDTSAEMQYIDARIAEIFDDTKQFPFHKRLAGWVAYLMPRFVVDCVIARLQIEARAGKGPIKSLSITYRSGLHVEVDSKKVRVLDAKAKRDQISVVRELRDTLWRRKYELKVVRKLIGELRADNARLRAKGATE